MDDDHPFDRTESGPGTLWHSLPEPKNRGLFRKSTPPEPEPRPRPAGPARLRVVTSLPIPPRTRIADAPPADAWAALRGARLPLDMAGANDAAVERAFDDLRTRLLKHMRSHALSRIAIAAPTAGCGTTFTAVNLAHSFATVPGLRTVLMDMNLHRPGVARALRLSGPDDMRGFLAGQRPPEAHFLRLSDTLATGLARRSDQPVAGLLNSDACALAVSAMLDRLQPGVLLCDMPPVLERDDLAAFLPQVDGVVLVADATRTRPEHITACEDRLAGQTQILGVVLNLARRTGPEPVHA